jgi:tetratricopeptide (TPR) repeat protein
MADSSYIEQIEQNINKLLSEKKITEAYQLCKKAITSYPDEPIFIQSKKKVEKAAHEENENVIKHEIAKIKAFTRQDDHVSVINLCQKLLKVSPHNQTLLKYLRKSQEIYKKKIKEYQKEFQKKENSELNKLMDEKKYQDVIDRLFKLEKNNPGNKDVLILTSTFRDKIIAGKIEDHHELIYSEKYEEIGHLIEQLKKIDPKNSRITKLEAYVHQEKFGSTIIDKKEYIYSAEQHLDTLMKLKKYDKAIQIAKEALRIAPSNKKIKNNLQKAEKKFFKQCKKFSIKDIKSKLPALQEEYNNNKENFIQI